MFNVKMFDRSYQRSCAADQKVLRFVQGEETLAKQSEGCVLCSVGGCSVMED